MWLFDTCSIINLSYCLPVAAVFKARYASRGGWVKAVQTELTWQRARQPPHPQAGRAMSWASTWLGMPIEIHDEEAMRAVETVRIAIAAGSGRSSLDHLGEAASILVLQEKGDGRLISDDRGARDEARRRGISAASTVGVVAKLLTVNSPPLTIAQAGTYLEMLGRAGRMHKPLTSRDLQAGDLGSWE